MNLHGIVASVIGAVNERVPVSIQVSTGNSTSSTYKPVPTYAAPFNALAQIQPLTSDDLKQIDGLNIQGSHVKIYLFGQVSGIIRATNKGGDLITVGSGPYAGIWLVVQPLEPFASAGWCSVACTLQNGS